MPNRKYIKIEEQLDELDLRIINALIEDGRISFRSLAKELDVSETTIYTRIKKLMNLGVIRGFHAEIDLFRLGYRTQAYVLIKVPARKIKDVSVKLRKLRGALEIYEVTGEYQFMIKFIGRSNEELARFIDELGDIAEISEIKIIYVIKQLKIPQEFKLPI